MTILGKAEARLSVLFLTRYPVSGASSRYRVFQYIPHLEAQGIKCTVQSFMDEPMYRQGLMRGRNIAKFGALIRAVFRRLSMLRRWHEFDALYLQRELLPFGPPLIERWLKRRGATILFDYDDALFIKKPSRFNPLATFFRSPGKTREMFRLADCTVAGNDWLRDAAIAEGGRAVTIEVAEDTSRIPMHAPHSDDRALTIGWLGSPSTVKYLRIIEQPLQWVAARHPDVSWEIMGGSEFQMGGVPWELHEWSLDAELAALARYDLGLMPLPNETWALGKSGGKARTYMAAGVVPVVTAIGYNLELIEHGRTGFLCKSEADWKAALELLIHDAGLRQRVAEAGRVVITQRFSPPSQARKIADLLVELCETEPHR
ncbi:MAG TPA: glycosyltransferase family 4 protein [Sphingomonadaceae bacterium]|nr:glycosyltransferase family 4 protein [Sphingomonadaceae bacterium]